MKPFDLERAIAGDPLVTRDGRLAHFVAHVPELGKNCRVLVRVENDPRVKDFSISGLYWGGSEHSKLDLFMAPKKRTVWVNFWDDNGLRCVPFPSETEARETKGWKPWTHVAIPVEIKE